MRWVAHYDDGTTFEGAYADIDRTQLVGFTVNRSYVPVPPGRRLVWRERHSIGKNVWDVDIVGIEDDDRKGRVWLFFSHGGMQRLRGYGTGVIDSPPVLLDCEI